MKRLFISAVAVTSFALVACDEDNATGTGPGLIPVEPQTVTIRLPWSEIGGETGTFRGFGSASELNRGVVAGDFDGVVTGKTLAFFRGFDDRVLVRRPEGGLVNSRSDFRRGRVVVKILRNDGTEDPARIRARSIETPWDVRTASWEMAIDSVGEMVPWGEPGVADAAFVGETVFDPLEFETGEADSLIIELDSMVVASLLDTAEVARGLVLETDGDGNRIAFESVGLILDLKPEQAPDTTVQIEVPPPLLTAIFDPVPTAVEGIIISGGAPGIRATLGVTIPDRIDVPNPACQQVTCPFVLDPDQVNVASLVLTSREAEPGFAPQDSVRLDFRAVLAPERLPKSPLTPSFVRGLTGHIAMGPELFIDGGSTEVAFPMTEYVRDQLRGETLGGAPPPETVVLLGFLEPTSFDVGTFAGPGTNDEPFVRLTLTIADPVTIR